MAISLALSIQSLKDTALNSDTRNELHVRPLVRRVGPQVKDVEYTRQSNARDYNPWQKNSDNPFEDMPHPSVDDGNRFHSISPILGKYETEGE